jgi:hypothetical protein
VTWVTSVLRRVLVQPLSPRSGLTSARHEVREKVQMCRAQPKPQATERGSDVSGEQRAR